MTRAEGYLVILAPDREAGGYTVVIPALPGALTEGDSREEALRNAAGVMDVFLELASENGCPPREETPELVAAEIRQVLEDRVEMGWDFELETVVVTPKPF